MVSGCRSTRVDRGPISCDRGNSFVSAKRPPYPRGDPWPPGHTTGNVGVDTGHYDETVSPDPPASTFFDPIIVTRDNPALKGSFWAVGSEVEALGKCSGKNCKYKQAIKSKWKNVGAWLSLDEHQEDQTLVTTYKGPILPIHKQDHISFHQW